MRTPRALLALALIGCLLGQTPRAQVLTFQLGTSLPPICALGQLSTITPGATGTPFPGNYLCTATNVWTLVTGFRSAPYAVPDNVFTNIFTVALPTPHTGCAVHTAFAYTATNGGISTVSHSGLLTWSFVNQNGTVLGDVASADASEAVAGTGCPAACDSYNIAAVSTNATAQIRFNNTLSVTGSFTFKVLANSCGPEPTMA